MRLLLGEIKDTFVQRNFKALADYFRANRMGVGFKHLELTFTSPVANFRTPHSLGFLPKDVIVTRLSGSGTVTWNYALFDRTNLDLTVSGDVSNTNPVVIRAYIGTHTEDAEVT